MEGDFGVNRGLGVLHRDTGFLFFISSRENDIWDMPWFGGD
jgi:hypothetical protein